MTVWVVVFELSLSWLLECCLMVVCALLLNKVEQHEVFKIDSWLMKVELGTECAEWITDVSL